MIKPERFLQRPIVEAMQFTGHNAEEISDWIKDRDMIAHTSGGLTMGIWNGNDAYDTVDRSDWVVYSPFTRWSVMSDEDFQIAHQLVGSLPVAEAKEAGRGN